jgi:arsenate reductase
MLACPILINRPIVVTPWGVRLCRPAERVREILPQARLSKPDGEQAAEPRRGPS